MGTIVNIESYVSDIQLGSEMIPTGAEDIY